MTIGEKCSKMRAGKARKREAQGAVATVSMGWAVFGGPLFGRHRVRLTCREDVPQMIYVSVDGRITCSKTQRGVKALLMRRIAKTTFSKEA